MINVLIVEDDPMVSEINKSYLNDIEGFRLTGSVATVKEAKKFLEKHEVDLILLDIFMPEQNGLSLLTHVRQTQKDVDFILITAAKDIKSIHKAFQYGAVDYIIKPFRFERFNQALVKYREQNKVLHEGSQLSQEELDRLLIEKRTSTDSYMLPKGLTKNTLQQIWSYIKEKDGEEFTTEEIAEVIGLSRISIRKYLVFLEKNEVLTSYYNYGNIGRPITMFQCQHDKQRVVDMYLAD